jgi:glycosyltransferase involved in cell wall biosynthesis
LTLLYVGRREPDKNTPQLIDYFIRYKTRHPGDLRLTFVGAGDPLPRRNDLIETEPDWSSDAMYRDADVFCHPSINESFSIVLMQAWLAELPAIVHGDCAVTREHCERSNGGLWFRSYVEFEELLDRLLASPALRSQLGRNGRAYVEREYSWDAVLRRFDSAMEQILGPVAAGAKVATEAE